jgi:hypothetical protein
MQTPAKAVSFDTPTARRRYPGPSKPWQMQHYATTPHTKELYSRGRQEYKRLIITKDAWPTQESRARFGKNAWEQVIKENPELYANCTSVPHAFASPTNCSLGSHKTFNNWVLRLVSHSFYFIFRFLNLPRSSPTLPGPLVVYSRLKPRNLSRVTTS